jgi:hypothetical protein
MGKVQRRDCTEFTEKKFRPKQVVYFLCVLGDAFARYAVKSF